MIVSSVTQDYYFYSIHYSLEFHFQEDCHGYIKGEFSGKGSSASRLGLGLKIACSGPDDKNVNSEIGEIPPKASLHGHTEGQ